jgi:drug/metabolite transporter (DMT)-like permease
VSPIPKPASTLFVAGHLAICAATWGSSFIFIKLTRGEVDPFTLSLIRAGIAAFAMAAWVMWLGQMPWPSRDEWQDWLVLGSVNGWIPNILVAFALERMAAGMASMVQAATPLFTAYFAHLLFADERLSRQRILGLAIGFGGTMLLVAPRLGQGGSEAWAILAMIGVVIGYGSGNIYARHRRAVRPERLALGQQVVSALVSLPLAFVIAGPTASVVAMHAHGWALAALGLFCTAVPILMFMRLITRAGPTKASMTGYLAPATAVVLATIVLGERLSPGQIVGGIVILIGVSIITLAPPARAQASP